jgi:hypothetical protein
MTIDELKRAGVLLVEIENAQGWIEKYLRAAEIVCARRGQVFVHHFVSGENPREIADALIAGLEARIAELRAELKTLGVE